MTEPTYQAQLYPATRPAGGGNRFAVCISGGGSRSLSCALGQLSALTTLRDPGDPGRSLLARAAHLSSVSGGSWASTAYTFLPETIDGQPVGDDDFLIAPTPPEKLSKGSEGEAAPGNVAYMNPHGLGGAPQNFTIKRIAEVLARYYRWGMFDSAEKLHWFWIATVGEIILRPFGLFDAEYPGDADWIEPSRSFSLSEQYVGERITPANPTLGGNDFYTCRAGRPPLIVNFNLLQNDQRAGPVQIPVQATPVHIGILGESPDGTIRGGGDVESFAFGSTLIGPGAAPDTAAVTAERRYSLCDIAGSSSAFFAAYIVGYINGAIDEIAEEIARIVPEFARQQLESFLERQLDLSKQAADLIPHYNYWPLSAVTGTPENRVYGVSDGGDFENTGLLGLLARTDAERVIVFVNSETPIGRSAKSGRVTVDPQLPRLFGLQGVDDSGDYPSYGGFDPAVPLSYAQVFDNGNGAFDALIDGLYQASCGGPGKDSALGDHPAAFTQTLTTIDNPVSGIRGGREVTVLWVYNNRVNRWQEAITDPAIQADLKRGQRRQHPDGTPAQKGSPLSGPLPNFPYYSTAEHICLGKEEVNMLAQLSAWNVIQLEGAIERLLA